MFSKLKEITKFNINPSDDIAKRVLQIQEEFAEGLHNILQKTFLERMSNPNNSAYGPQDVEAIIEGYAKKNMMIAAATSIVPGPFGILGSIPELILNFKNQMSMIYDLGCANGKENFINKDVLLDIPIAAFGGNTNLSILQNEQIDLSDSMENVLIDKALTLSKTIVEKTLKKSVVQFIPVAGPILMGTWSKMSTKKISKVACGFLDDREVYIENVKPEENQESELLLQIEKIKGLANLIESNNEINESQIELIGTIIENSALSDEKKSYFLEESLKEGSKFDLNKSLLIQYEENDDLIMDMIVMAKRSGNVDELEKEYILKTGIELNVDQELIEDLLTTDQ